MTPWVWWGLCMGFQVPNPLFVQSPAAWLTWLRGIWAHSEASGWVFCVPGLLLRHFSQVP